MRGKQLKEKFARDEYTYGTHIIGLVSPLIPEWMVANSMDFAFICNEHIPLDRSEISQMCKMYASLNVSPMVRIPYPDARQAIIAVEGGAEGIVAPYVEKPSEFIGIINSLRYRPIKGEFLAAISDETRLPSKKLSDYLTKLNEHLYFVAGVESVYAMENLDAILETDGVSAIFLGPHDISCSMEIPCEYGNPIFTKTVCEVIKKCRKAGKPVGVHSSCLLPEFMPFLSAGANLIINGSDITSSIAHMKSELDFIRNTYDIKDNFK